MEFMQEAISLANKSITEHGGPFGAVITKNGKIVGRGNNKVTINNDPTAHAEVTAIRDACEKLKTFDLSGCEIYSSCEPCPMCLAAIYWARLDKVHFGATRVDAADIGFDDHFFYEELALPLDQRHVPMYQVLHDEAVKVMQQWYAKEDKVEY